MPVKSSFDRMLLYITSAAVLLLVVITATKWNKKDIAYVDIGKLVSNYKYRKDMESVSSKNLFRIRNIIDSMKLAQRLHPAGGQIDTQINRATVAFNQYYVQSNEEISKKVWDRLNPVIQQFGKDRGLELLVGANGAGTVLFGSKEKDVTDDLTTYINAKYEKGN